MFPCIVKEIEIEGKGKKTNAFGSVPRLQEKVQLNTEISRFDIQSSFRRDRRLNHSECGMEHLLSATWWQNFGKFIRKDSPPH